MDTEFSLKNQTKHAIGNVTSISSERLGMSPDLLNQTIHATGHELRSPIFVVRSYAHLLQKVQDSTKIKVGFGMIEEATIKMEKLVDGLVALIDLYTQPVPKSEPVSSENLIRSVRFELSDFFSSDNPNFIVNITALNDIQFPKKCLVDLLVQLLDNAFRHNSEQKNLSVRCTAKRVEDGILLIVSDNGKGIDLTNSSNKVTAPFYTYSDDDSCIGLGLAKVSAIVQVTGCTQHLESTPGQGTQFYLKIPFSKYAVE